ncbi:hypothetical protein [Cohnella rhizosphaerae]|uniref:Uncharacterized protein n=1 Tax=Cohnella rhizosphaerae TaxID=1457232 RepID=A0A9X4KY04_9BACL|nr:hypothetical protein [Cohnella rhizosphaerae]MDG0810414.1 hypothetical protein [Cohnella rhizosphaerae]
MNCSSDCDIVSTFDESDWMVDWICANSSPEVNASPVLFNTPSIGVYIFRVTSAISHRLSVIAARPHATIMMSVGVTIACGSVKYT